jgi:hypothetical protein
MSTPARSADRKRLKSQRSGVWNILRDHRWHPLTIFKQKVKGSDSSITARIRDARKKKYGGHIIQCARDAAGVYRYRLVR